MNVEQRRLVLEQIVSSPDASSGERLAALRELDRLTGGTETCWCFSAEVEEWEAGELDQWDDVSAAAIVDAVLRDDAEAERRYSETARVLRSWFELRVEARVRELADPAQRRREIQEAAQQLASELYVRRGLEDAHALANAAEGDAAPSQRTREAREIVAPPGIDPLAGWEREKRPRGSVRRLGDR